MNYKTLAVAVSADLVSLALHHPPLHTGTELLLEALKGFEKDAREELLDAMKAGEIEAIEASNQDETVKVIYRYYVAARDGAARENLRLMARCIVNLQTRDCLYVSEFAKYSDALSRMTRDQITIASAYFKHACVLMKITDRPLNIASALTTDKFLLGIEDELRKAVQEAMIEVQYDVRVIAQLEGELSGLGLLSPHPTIGGIQYTPTPKLFAIGDMALQPDQSVPLR